MKLDERVVAYLTKHNIVYTKTLYKAIKVKTDYELSQNKFRDLLYTLESKGTIKLTSYNGLNAWSVVCGT